MPEARTAYIALDDGHSICGERSSFVGTDCGRTSHCFACINVSNEIIVAHHFLSVSYLKPNKNNTMMGKSVQEPLVM